MERREHYDPEDIESLLQERGFDELLDEERAYVLRHLSGRDEYEAMRALLFQVRDDERTHPPLQADPLVKSAVMAAFRAQQRPQWSIWLNSVGALLWPKELSALWRPALALATIALFVVVGVQVTKDGAITSEQGPLAELKEPSKPATDQAASTVNADERLNTTTSGSTSDQEQKVVVVQQHQEEAASAAEAPAPPMMDEAPVAEALADDIQERTAASGDIFKKTESATSVAPTSILEAEPSHIVTDAELARNMSTANATGAVSRTVAAKEKYHVGIVSTGAAMSDSPELLALLNTGW